MALLAPVSLVPSVLVALVVVTAPAWACLLCFTTYSERLRVCKIFTGMEASALEKCETAFTAAFQDLRDMEISYDERGRLHDVFTQMTHSLQETAVTQTTLALGEDLYYKDPLCPVESYEGVFRAAAEAIKKDMAQLKEAPDCIPPCGIQEVSRRFRCRGCYSTLCDLPLDCPVQDLKVIRGDQAMFSCDVNFELPKEITYSWKFVGGGLRTQDQTYFRELPGARGNVARIRPVQPTHRGTFSCEIVHEQRPLARLYFFLNVTGPPPRGETELQVSFREVVRWALREREVTEPWKPSLGELLATPGALTLSNQRLLAAAAAFLSATLILLGWMFCRWYFSGS